jgi:hypothetical protein
MGRAECRLDVGFYRRWEVREDEKWRVNYFGMVDWEFFFGVIIVCWLQIYTSALIDRVK